MQMTRMADRIGVLAGLSLALGLSTACFAQVEKPASAAPAQVEKKDDKKETVPAKEVLAYVQLETSKGSILLELNQTKAPLSVENFLRYVDKGHYNGTVFHRVMNGFMIQGGGFDEKLTQKAVEAPIKNESANGLKNERYTIAMARTSNPDSATAQFYINVADNNSLDRANPRAGSVGYAVFGRVVAGQSVVDKIKAVPTGVRATSQGEAPNVPLENVVISSAKRLSDDEAAKVRNAAGGASDKSEPATPAAKPVAPAEPKTTDEKK